jgi:DNA-binding MarR family transcriptional regulator
MPDLTRLFDDLIRFETRLWDAVDARLRSDLDLQLTWFEPMQVIGRNTSCRVHDIAQELAITVGGVSKLVDRIEAAGYCRRMANPDDRRSSLIELTPIGDRVLSRARRAFEDELRTQIGSVVSARQLAQFMGTLGKLRAATTARHGAAAAGEFA